MLFQQQIIEHICPNQVISLSLDCNLTSSQNLQRGQPHVFYCEYDLHIKFCEFYIRKRTPRIEFGQYATNNWIIVLLIKYSSGIVLLELDQGS